MKFGIMTAALFSSVTRSFTHNVTTRGVILHSEPPSVVGISLKVCFFHQLDMKQDHHRRRIGVGYATACREKLRKSRRAHATEIFDE